MLVIADDAPISARPDLLVHALAQLPDDIELRLPAGVPRGDQLELLAAAYGVGDRLHFDAEPGDRDGSLVAAPGDGRSMAELVGALGNGVLPASARRGHDGLFRGHRVAILTNLATHYRVPLLNGIAARLAAAGACLRVLFTAARPFSRSYMAPEPIAFDHEFLRSVSVPVGVDAPLNLERRIRSFSPTVMLVPGFSPAVAVRAALCARWMRIPYGVWSGEIPQPQTEQPLRGRQRRVLLKRAAFAISYGHLSADYLRSLAPDVPVVYGRNTTSTLADLQRVAKDDGLVEVLAVARAIPGKRLDVAVAAFEHLRDVPCRLTIIGDGTALAALKQRASGLDNVRFLGAVLSDRTHEAYGASAIFLFPTSIDVFGLVLVEAMGAGLATVVSSTPGAVADLALAGRNCVVVDGHDPLEWAAAIRSLVEDPQRRRAIGDQARRTVMARWTVDHAVDAMIAGLRLGVLAGASRRSR